MQADCMGIDCEPEGGEQWADGAGEIGVSRVEWLRMRDAAQLNLSKFNDQVTHAIPLADIDTSMPINPEQGFEFAVFESMEEVALAVIDGPPPLPPPEEAPVAVVELPVNIQDWMRQCDIGIAMWKARHTHMHLDHLEDLVVSTCP
jgi:hypothetical protein